MNTYINFSFFMGTFADAGFAYQAALTGIFELTGYSKAPVIFVFLALLCFLSLGIWFYGLLNLKITDLMPEEFVFNQRKLLLEKRYEKALTRCYKEQTLTANILARGMEARKRGPEFMIEAIQNEGKRRQQTLWDKIKHLQEIAIAALVVGVIGSIWICYVSYFNDQATEKWWLTLITCLGPVIFGMAVSALSFIFAAILKKRINYLMNTIINEILTLVRTVDLDYR